jgi:hypothetical protein
MNGLTFWGASSVTVPNSIMGIQKSSQSGAAVPGGHSPDRNITRVSKRKLERTADNKQNKKGETGPQSENKTKSGC